MVKALILWIVINWKIFKFLEMGYQTILHVTKQHLEPYMEQVTSSELGKAYKAFYCHPI